MVPSNQNVLIVLGVRNAAVAALSTVMHDSWMATPKENAGLHRSLDALWQGDEIECRCV